MFDTSVVVIRCHSYADHLSMSCGVILSLIMITCTIWLLVCKLCVHCSPHCLVGLVVKPSTLRAEDLGFESCLRRGYRVSAGTGWPSVSIL